MLTFTELLGRIELHLSITENNRSAFMEVEEAAPSTAESAEFRAEVRQLQAEVAEMLAILKSMIVM